MSDTIKTTQIEDVDDTELHHFQPAWMESSDIPKVSTTQDQVNIENEVVNDSDTSDDIQENTDNDASSVHEKVQTEEIPLEFVDDGNTSSKTKVSGNIDEILASIYNEATSNKEINPATPDDLKLTIPLSNSDDVSHRIIQEGYRLGPEAFSEEIQDKSTYLYSLRTAMEYFTSEVSLMRKILEDSARRNEDNTKTLIETLQRTVENIGVTTARGIPSNVSRSKVVSGKDALVTVASLMQGVKRIPLWNSGIYITIKAPSIKDLIAYYNSVSIEGYDFGRENGAYYFMYADYKIKRVVLEQLLPKCLVGCNYKHWQNTKKLIRVISLHDYDVILWALASMIYRDGVPIKVVCAHEDCNYSEEVIADLSKMRFVDTSKLTPEAIEYMSNSDVKNNKDIADYYSKLKIPDVYKFKTVNKATGDITYWCFDITTANCADYLDQGEALYADLLKENSAPTETDVVNFFSINHYRSYIPWIANIKCITEEGYHSDVVKDKDVIFTINGSDVNNKEVLNHILDITQMETTDFPKFIEDYISRTKITYIAYPMSQCPKCHKPSEFAVQGFVPYDMQMHFFMMSLMRIWKTA
jgi:hypothetical protein